MVNITQEMKDSITEYAFTQRKNVYTRGMCPICVEDSTRLFECYICKDSACKECWNSFFETSNQLKCMFCKSKTITYYWKHVCTKEVYDSVSGLLWKNYIGVHDDIVTPKGRRVRTSHLEDSIMEMLGVKDSYFHMCNFVSEITKTELSSGVVLKQPCPVENCRGILCDSRCLSCNASICEFCNIVTTGTDHTCKKEDIESYREIQKLHSCPNCSVKFVSDGCNSNYCLVCQTYFNRSTGEISQVPRHTGETLDKIDVVYEGDFIMDIRTIENMGIANPYIFMYISHAKKVKTYLSLSQKNQYESQLALLKTEYLKGIKTLNDASNRYIQMKDYSMHPMRLFYHVNNVFKAIQDFYKNNDSEQLTRDLEQLYIDFINDKVVKVPDVLFL